VNFELVWTEKRGHTEVKDRGGRWQTWTKKRAAIKLIQI